MNIVEQKLVSALNLIYDSKFDRAIMECNEVLEFEPNNVMAMKRLGSAYYALKKVDKAKQVWKDALRYAPNDEDLKSFLKY
jgi:Tfp pilus assembly protein PilF